MSEVVPQTAVAAPKALPDGYDDWALNIAAVAETGTEALKAAWKSSPKGYREATSQMKIDLLRSLAKQADKAAEAKAAE